MEGSLVAYKTFTNGSVLPASDVQTYLMDQSVMIFSSSATRAAALTAPVEGMLTYLDDVNRYESYNGTAWVTFGSSAILQVVSATKTDTFSTASTSYVDITGLSVSITPKFTSSKILALVTLHSGRLGGLPTFQLVRGATAIAIGDAASLRQRSSSSAYTGASAEGTTIIGSTINFLDSPSTTSATTYKVQGRIESSTLFINRTGTDTDSATFPRTVSTITLMEVAG